MKIFVITPIYATTTCGDAATPVVHYFAREWVKSGHEVTVFNIVSRFPRFYYWVSKMFKNTINSILGIAVPTSYPSDENYVVDGVKVIKRVITKYQPHSMLSKSKIDYTISIINKEIAVFGVPDCFIGHWDSPCIELLPKIKELYNKPVSLVFHSNKFSLINRFGSDVVTKLKSIDLIGFRSRFAQEEFEKTYFIPKNSFICYSGVPEMFLSEGKKLEKQFSTPIKNFIYIGSLIKRKFSSRLYDALTIVYPQGNFNVTFIGDGAEKTIIRKQYDIKKIGDILFTGRIPRTDVISHLRKSEIFVMISKDEIFGLVYLEAMAFGLIPIGSRNEGIDGIINDGENGFLCEAGNTDELIKILKRINRMSKAELSRISSNAILTASKYSDENVAKNYLQNIKQIL